MLLHGYPSSSIFFQQREKRKKESKKESTPPTDLSGGVFSGTRPLAAATAEKTPRVGMNI
jgi:hypothetical protein